jgi:hypothetical protein
MLEECQGLFGADVLYFLLVEPNHYKFGITQCIYSRLRTHARTLKFISIVRVFKCPSRNASFRVEQKFKKYAKNEGILVRKYGQTEIINTNNPQKYIDWLEQEIRAETEGLGLLAIVDDISFAVRIPKIRIWALIFGLNEKYTRNNIRPGQVGAMIKVDANIKAQNGCDKCGQKFKLEHHLKQHLARKRSCIVAVDDATNPLRCMYCKQIYSTNSNLLKHSRKCKMRNGGVAALPAQLQVNERVLILEEEYRKKDEQTQKELIDLRAMLKEMKEQLTVATKVGQ